jgi:DNA-binding NarL/FixJ family response regulator
MIFIVDDSKILQERLVDMLSEIEGVEVIGQAYNAVDAIAGIQTLKPRVVILDIQMPGGNGIEMLKTIKQGSYPPVVIMLTNHPYSQYREKCMELGADFFLDKTRDFNKLTGIFKGLHERFGQEDLSERLQ